MDLQYIKLEHAIVRHSDKPDDIDIEFNPINC